MEDAQPQTQMDAADGALETRSQSDRSRRSTSSSASAAATAARAKAAACKVKASYAEKEARMMREKAVIEEQQQRSLAETARRKAEVEAELYVLSLEKEAVAASTEADVYEAAACAEEMKVFEEQVTSVRNSIERTKEYVQMQNNFPEPPMLTPHPTSSCHDVRSYVAGSTNSHAMEKHEERNKHPELVDQDHISQKLKNIKYDSMFIKTEPVDAADHTIRRSFPEHSINVQQPFKYKSDERQTHTTPPVSDLAMFLLKKETVSSGLFHFDDRPENYWAWKTSFQAVISDLEVTSREEIDLLVRWLGPESSKHAKRIKSVHVSDPVRGVTMIWHRLEECYENPEVVEQALLKRLDVFPRITPRDTNRLRELGDLLQELLSAKMSGYFPGFAYLDTARGVKPIVEKLPFSLQDRWITQGSRFKEEHHVYFPPFGFFVEFVCREARNRNDPSFAITAPGYRSNAREEEASRLSNRTSVFVNKTEINTVRESQDRNFESNVEPDKFCTLHNKPHPLCQCQTFRNKHLDERKTHLKERSICFRCCSSTSHMARDCKASVKCRECNSDRHVAAMHPGPAPWAVENSETKSEPPARMDENADEVNNKCTEICGDVSKPKSCSKICLVKVYPINQREKAKLVYAVLDEQSNRSLVKSQFFDLFDTKGCLSPYTLKTCSGVMSTAGRKANGFCVESLDGRNAVPLPPLLECDALPDDRSEIPTPEVALHYAHLNEVSNKIPPLNPEASILLLLGRDIIQVHKVREQRNGPNNAPYAQRLDLGWVIVGEACLDGTPHQNAVNVYKTHVFPNGRPSYFETCRKSISAVERPLLSQMPEPEFFKDSKSEHHTESLKDNVFFSSSADNKVALSVEDTGSLDIMDREVYIGGDKHWVALLPFKSQKMSALPTDGLSVDPPFTNTGILDGLLAKTPTRLTHEVLTTLMAEVMAIMNSRPLIPISTDASMPQVLSPAMLLTQKASVAPAPPGNFELGHLHKKQWRQVQMLADSFWKRWKQDYLSTLQTRRKWTEKKDNIQEGDIVLLKDGETKRSEWPIGLITKTVPSPDGTVRKVMVKTAKQGVVKEYLRPVFELVLLLPCNANV